MLLGAPHHRRRCPAPISTSLTNRKYGDYPIPTIPTRVARDPCRPLYGRWRSRPLYWPPRHATGGQGGVDRRDPAADVETPANPAGTPIEAFDQLRASVVADRSQLFKDLSAPFYGANRPGATVSQGLRDSFWLQGMMAGFPAAYFCIKAFSETDLTEDLKKIRDADHDPAW